MTEIIPSARTISSRFNKYFNSLDRIFVIHMLLLVVGLGIILFFVYNNFQREKTKAFEDESLYTVKLYGSLIESDLNNLKNRLSEISCRNSIINFDKEGENTLRDFHRFYWACENKEFIVAVRRVSENLKTIYSVPENQNLNEGSVENSFLSSNVNFMKPCISGLFKDPDGHRNIAVYSPVFDSDKRFLGWVSATIDMESLVRHYLSKVQVRGIGRSWIVDSKGNLIISNSYSEKALKVSLMTEVRISLLEQMMEQREGATVYNMVEKGGGVPRILAFSKIRLDEHTDWFICIDATEGEIADCLPRFEILEKYYLFPVITFIFMGGVLMFGYRFMANYYTRLLKEQLLQSQKMEAMGMFVNGIAHDFNNIVQLISGISYMLKDNDGKATDKDIRLIDEIAEKSYDLTSRLISFSKGSEKEKQSVNVSSCIKGLLGIVQLMIGRRITLRHHLVHDLPAINVSPAQVEEIIINLCVNALDAMPDGGTLTISTNVLPAAERTGILKKRMRDSDKYIHISVSDTGTGIPKDIQKKIFEPFFTTKGEKGSGLGLSTVLMIVEDLEGQIGFESENNKGTKFHIYLPVDKMKD